MSKIIIEGGYPLCGVIDIQGAKNSILPILAATFLADGDCIVENCPDISDTHAAIDILRALGSTVTVKGNTVYINSDHACGFEIPDLLMRKMRSSIMFLGAIIGRKKRALVSFPGGCELGPRPIDLHLSALAKMGVSIREEFGYLDCECEKINGTVIDLSFPSVGATENVMLAAVKAEGITVINNAAKEPEIEDLQNFLVKMGAKIHGAGSGKIVIEGVSELTGARHSVIPDRIVTATYLCAVAVTGGNALLKKANDAHLGTFLSFLRESGCEINVYDDAIQVSCDGLKGGHTVRTMPFPGFATDAQAVCMALMCKASGSTVFIETIFESRFKHVGELLRMGAKITAEGRVAVVEGVKRLYGTTVEAGDLRGGASLVVAGLAAEGTTVVDNAEHIYRGYENIVGKLSDLGAKVYTET